VSNPAARHVVAVGSGKGGVGKSTVTLNLALAFARQGWRVGLVDADLYGPDIPLMLNLKREHEAERWDFWRGGDVRFEPLEHDGIQVMSVGFLLGERQSLPFAAPLLGAVLRQLIEQADWQSRDVLLIDLPPGTADLQQQLPSVVALAGAVVVVGPQDVAHLDARKFVHFLRGANIRVLGGVENMSALACPHCGERVDVFPPAAPDRQIWSDGVPLLGRIPLDPVIGRQADEFDRIAADLGARLEAA
jgi:ATP-binding protein involved in chromosome partitioning